MCCLVLWLFGEHTLQPEFSRLPRTVHHIEFTDAKPLLDLRVADLRDDFVDQPVHLLQCIARFLNSLEFLCRFGAFPDTP